MCYQQPTTTVMSRLCHRRRTGMLRVCRSSTWYLYQHCPPRPQVKYDPSSGLVVSASYDKTLRLWQLGARAHETGCLQVREGQCSAWGATQRV